MCVLTGKALFRFPFQWKEFILQCWFILRVALLPTMAVSVPVTALFIFTFNILLIQVGAADISGAGAGIAVITQIGPINTVLVIAGAVSTAICADLGARTIREEIDAMEVLGIDPIHRLVVPRVLACALCGMLLNALVSMVGLVGGFLFGVYMQNVSARRIPGHADPRHRAARSRHRDDQGAGLRAHRRSGRLLPRADGERRFQGSGHRGQRNRGAVRGGAVKGGSKGLGTAVNETVVLCVVALSRSTWC